MSGAGIRIKVDSSPFQKGFDEIIKKGQDLTPLMRHLGEYFVDETNDRFDEERAPDGTAWEKSKSATDAGRKTLNKDSVLRKSINYKHDAHGVRWGTNRKYAAIHQFGGVIKPKNGKYLTFPIGDSWVKVKSVTIEKREYLGVNDDDIEAVHQHVADYFLKG